MGITNEQLKAENIRNISIIDLAKATTALAEEQNQVQAEMVKAHQANDIDLLLAHASTNGVLTVQQDVIMMEVSRRDEEAPMTAEEKDELHAYVMEQALVKLLGTL